MTIIFVGAIAVPIGVGLACGVSPGAMLGLASSVILFQALAAVVGLGLTIHPAFVLVVMTSVALTVILTIFEVCDTFAHRSIRIQGWIGKMKVVSESLGYLSQVWGARSFSDHLDTGDRAVRVCPDRMDLPVAGAKGDPADAHGLGGRDTRGDARLSRNCQSRILKMRGSG